MNAEFVGPFDVSPRGHPADGRVEVIAVDDGLGLRARLQARRRLRTGTHLPHPAISTRSSRAGEWVFDRPMAVAVDGRRHRGVRTLRFEVLAAGAVVYF
jgi:diacylglycerol kinase family enzyme